MLEITNLPKLDKYRTHFPAGETLFLEGDPSQDMYLLVKGVLEVFKDDKKISVISELGTMVGEMAFLLGERRSTTVKAATDAEVIQIPAAQISDFMCDFPTLAPKIAATLAKRLQETTRVVHGLREFCDQLPDAVIMTDKEHRILAWNRAAERLHGRKWEQMQNHSLAEVYEDPQEYRQFIAELHAGHTLSEKKLAVVHPDGDRRYVSTSTNILYDGHHNVDGYLFLSRDITGATALEQKYSRIKKIFLPTIALAAILAIGFFVSLPFFSKGIRMVAQRQANFTQRIVEDSRSLSPPLLRSNAAPKVFASLAQDYFANQGAEFFGITALTLLNRDKQVVFSLARPDKGYAAPVGHNYSGITFSGDKKSPYKILNLFHTNGSTTMGRRGVELAYRLNDERGWLLFQLDMNQLSEEFAIDEKVLSRLDFK